MTDDLTARLERALHVQEQHERDLQPDAATLADLHARVGRQRRARTASVVAVAAASALVVGVAGWFALQDRGEPVPAQTPTPTVEPTPAPSSPSSPTPEADAAPPVPVELPGLPPMLEAPDGILDTTGPGWFLAFYVSGLYEPPAGDGERRTLALSAPTGELYHLTDLEGGVTPVRWSDPDRARVAVAPVWPEEGTLRVGWVDLRTGAFTVDDRAPVDVAWVGMAGDDEVWFDEAIEGPSTLHVVPPSGAPRTISATLLPPVDISPDGRTVVGRADHAGTAVVAVDLATGRVTTVPEPAGQVCHRAAWIDATGVLASCVDRQGTEGWQRWNYDEHGGQVVRLDVTGKAPQTLTTLRADGVVPWYGRWLRDGVVVTSSAPLLSSSDCYDFCYGGAFLWESGEARPVTTSVELGDEICEVDVATGGLLLRTGDLCYEETTGNQWWLVDEATGVTRNVAPAVDSDLGIGARNVFERS